MKYIGLSDLRGIHPGLVEREYKLEDVRTRRKKAVRSLDEVLLPLLGHEQSEARVKCFLVKDSANARIQDYEVLVVSYYASDEERQILLLDFSGIFSGKEIKPSKNITVFQDWCVWSGNVSGVTGADLTGAAKEGIIQLSRHLFALLLLALQEFCGQPSFSLGPRGGKVDSLKKFCEFLHSKSSNAQVKKILFHVQRAFTNNQALNEGQKSAIVEVEKCFNETSWHAVFKGEMSAAETGAAAATSLSRQEPVEEDDADADVAPALSDSDSESVDDARSRSDAMRPPRGGRFFVDVATNTASSFVDATTNTEGSASAPGLSDDFDVEWRKECPEVAAEFDKMMRRCAAEEYSTDPAAKRHRMG